MSKNIVKTNTLKYEFGPLPTLSNIDNNVQYDHGITMCMHLEVYFCTLPHGRSYYRGRRGASSVFCPDHGYIPQKTAGQGYFGLFWSLHLV